MRYLFSTLLLIAFSSAVIAHNDNPLTYNRINLSEQASSDVDNDLLVAVMFVQKEGRHAAALAKQVNKAILQAVDLAKRVKGVKVQTLSYRTNATYHKSAINGWRVNQSIRLESQDSKVLGELIGELQDQLQVKSIGYQVSDEERRKHTDILIEEALKSFQQRASRISKGLGYHNYKIVRLNINNGQSQPRPVAFNMAASRQMQSAPVRIEAGTQRIEVSVNGEIELLK